MIKRNFRLKSRSVVQVYSETAFGLLFIGRMLISWKRCRGGRRRWLRGWRGTLIATGYKDTGSYYLGDQVFESGSD